MFIIIYLISFIVTLMCYKELANSYLDLVERFEKHESRVKILIMKLSKVEINK